MASIKNSSVLLPEWQQLSKSYELSKRRSSAVENHNVDSQNMFPNHSLWTDEQLNNTLTAEDKLINDLYAYHVFSNETTVL